MSQTPYLVQIANKIGVTQSVNGSWIQAIAESTISVTGSTPGGAADYVQYNDGSGGFTGDASFTRSVTGPSQSFFVNSLVGTEEFSMGTGDWEPVIGTPILASALSYTSGDIFSGLFVGDTTEAGFGKGLTVFNQDDVSGDTTIITVTYSGMAFIIATDTVSGGLSMDNTFSEMSFEEFGVAKGELLLDASGSILGWKDESAGPDEAHVRSDIDGVTVKTEMGGFNLPDVESYDDDTAAGAAGLPTGRVYQTTGSGSSPLNVAGILMIKQ